MALSVVTTVGSAAANSLVSVAEADGFADEVFPLSDVEPWLTASGDAKARALVTAQRVLEELPWQGERVDSTQALALPRAGLFKPDRLTTYLTTEIPAAAKKAQAFLAFWMVRQDAAGQPVTAPSETPGLTAVAFGSELSMSFDPARSAGSALDRFLAQVIRPMLEGLVYTPGFRTVRG